jgi:hypothetical protein
MKIALLNVPPLLVRAGIVALAGVAALAPGSPARIERWYSRGVYPGLQRVMTGASNMTSLAVVDVLLALAILIAIVWIVIRVRARKSAGWGRVLLRLAGDAIVAAAVVYLVFLAGWGLNYRRVPLRETLDFDQARVTHEAFVTLTTLAVDELNRSHAPAHASEWPALDTIQGPLTPAFDAAGRDLGLSRPVVTGRPKRSLLSWYFRRAAIDGMTNPFALEILVNPDVLPFERPMVVAHEWAHLAGFAEESEAGFVGWIACVRGGDQTRYSAWLSLFMHLAAELPNEDYAAAMTRLDPGPRDDLLAIVDRVRQSVPVVRSAARRVYAGYLKANRVESGVASYHEVVALVAGTRFGEGFVPRLRDAPPR